MLAEPEDFREGEGRDDVLSEEVKETFLSAGGSGDFRAFIGCTGIAPEECRPDYVVRGIEEDRAVHLSGEANGIDGSWRDSGSCADGFNAFDGGGPPLLIGGLLGPLWLGCTEAVFLCVGGEDCAIFREQDGFCAAGSDVDSEISGHIGLLWHPQWMVWCLLMIIMRQQRPMCVYREGESPKTLGRWFWLSCGLLVEEDLLCPAGVVTEAVMKGIHG